MAGEGKPKTGGRKKGATNLINREVKERLFKMGADPLGSLWRLGQDCERDGERAIAATCYKELAKYMHPALKAVEHEVRTAKGSVFEVNMVGIDPPNGE